MAGMTKLLRKALKKLRELPVERQDALAEMLLSMVEETPAAELDDATLTAIEEGIAQAELGGLAADHLLPVLQESRDEIVAHTITEWAPASSPEGAGGARVRRLLPVLEPVEPVEMEAEVDGSRPRTGPDCRQRHRRRPETSAVLQGGGSRRRSIVASPEHLTEISAVFLWPPSSPTANLIGLALVRWI
jgi:hypothetical protein